MSVQRRVSRFVPERLRRSYIPEHPRQVLAQELPDEPRGPSAPRNPRRADLPAELRAKRAMSPEAVNELNFSLD